ncbi:MAG: hypothetical protein AAGE05_10620 [Pseudomonadota bacterium]
MLFASGMELFRGLRDRSVTTELAILGNSGNVINRPRQRLAAMEQNVRWFDIHLFADRASLDIDLPD